MIRCVVVDDEPLALEQLVSYVGNTPFLELAGGCYGAIEAMALLARRPVDLVFVDINMPDLNGMDFVKSLSGNRPMIVFTTAYSEYALEGYRVNALDYLLKPIGYKDFLAAAEKAAQQFELLHPSSHQVSCPDELRKIVVKSEYKIIQIALDDILYIEGRSEYVRIYTENSAPVMSLASLKSMEDRLPPDCFLRVHRSYIVHLSKIIEVARNRLFLGKDIYLPVGEQYKEIFNEYLSRHSAFRF